MQKELIFYALVAFGLFLIFAEHSIHEQIPILGEFDHKTLQFLGILCLVVAFYLYNEKRD